MIYHDRQHAGTVLAGYLSAHLRPDSLIVGITCGGVVVASAVADALRLPLQSLAVKKIPHPHDPELALGAVTYAQTALNSELITDLGISPDYIQSMIRQKQRIAGNLQMQLGYPPQSLISAGTVVLVDDGIATGATLDVAITWAHAHRAESVIAAAPVAPPVVIQKLQPRVRTVVVPETPPAFHYVGDYYEQFEKLSDGKVIELVKSKGIDRERS